MATFTLSNLDVDNAAEQITATETLFERVCYVKAGPGNGSDLIYVGFADTVTAGTADATDGYPLSAGQVMEIPVSVVNDVSEIWVIGGTTNLKVFAWGY